MNVKKKKTLTIAECLDLLRHILVIDPKRRYTIPDIVAHKWVKADDDDPDFSRLIRDSLNACDVNNDRELNDTVLHHMGVLGCDQDETIKVDCLNICESIFLGKKKGGQWKVVLKWNSFACGQVWLFVYVGASECKQSGNLTLLIN